MRGISPIPTWAAASSINMTPQTCLPVSAEGEGELSTCGWEGLQVGNFCLGVGEVNALAESLGEGPLGVEVFAWNWESLEGKGLVAVGASSWNGRICKGIFGPPSASPSQPSLTPPPVLALVLGVRSLSGQQRLRKAMGWDPSRKAFLTTVHSDSIMLGALRTPNPSSSPSDLVPHARAPAPATLGLAWPLGHLPGQWLLVHTAPAVVAVAMGSPLGHPAALWVCQGLQLPLASAGCCHPVMRAYPSWPPLHPDHFLMHRLLLRLPELCRVPRDFFVRPGGSSGSGLPQTSRQGQENGSRNELCLRFLQSMLEVMGVCPSRASGGGSRVGHVICRGRGHVLLDGVAHAGLSL